MVAVLGAIAGATIFLGLPVARAGSLSPGWRAFLNAVAIGVLLFILWDVAAQAIEPLEAALTAADGSGGWAGFLELAAIAGAGIVVGLMGLIHYQDWTIGRTAGRRAGPGAASAGELARRRPAPDTEADPIGAADRRRHRPAKLRRGPGDRSERGRR
jgi:ZIP family zinc transporter